jgi:hypothetical protein
MKLFMHGFWSGFIEKTNPTHVGFFIELFKTVFQETIELGSFEESDILLETIFDHKTRLFDKKWRYTFLYSGESRLNNWNQSYDCVLYGEKNHGNIINVPLFVPMLFCSGRLAQLLQTEKREKMPSKHVCAIISNPRGYERNAFLERLEKRIPVEYAGSYKNNVPKIVDMYNTDEFISKIRDYKFIVSMENSRGETYITEKILHGFHANIIPIYWGSSNVGDYFNTKRFLHVSDIHQMDQTIDTMVNLIQNENKYMEMLDQPVFPKNVSERTIESIAEDIKSLLFKGPCEKISKTFVVSSPEFEKDRYDQLQTMFQNMGMKFQHIEFICPTYKHTITDDIMANHVKQNLVKRLRHLGMKKSEISLFLNYKAVLEKIQKNYSDGIFLIFESDAIAINEHIPHFNDFINEMYKKKDQWDLIHIGSDTVNNQYFTSPYIKGPTPYRGNSYVSYLPQTYVEDITNEKDKYRLIRKFHTRCADSFLWNYRGVVEFLNCMNRVSHYDAPFDYYLTNFFETHLHFKHYWSMDTFFVQGSNMGLYPSTIQRDTS